MVAPMPGRCSTVASFRGVARKLECFFDSVAICECGLVLAGDLSLSVYKHCSFTPRTHAGLCPLTFFVFPLRLVEKLANTTPHLFHGIKDQWLRLQQGRNPTSAHGPRTFLLCRGRVLACTSRRVRGPACRLCRCRERDDPPSAQRSCTRLWRPRTWLARLGSARGRVPVRLRKGACSQRYQMSSCRLSPWVGRFAA